MMPAKSTAPSTLPISLSNEIAITTIDTPISSGMSRRTMRWDTVSAPTIADAPRINKMLPMFEPTTLPKATSALPLAAAPMLTANSGALVPNATTVRPTMTGGIPSRVATAAAPLTRNSAPRTRAIRPTTSATRVQAVTAPVVPKCVTRSDDHAM